MPVAGRQQSASRVAGADGRDGARGRERLRRPGERSNGRSDIDRRLRFLPAADEASNRLLRRLRALKGRSHNANDVVEDQDIAKA